MLNITDKHNCTGCSACASACPSNCIIMKADEEGFLYPITDKDRCIGCSICKSVCPIINKKKITPFKQEAYASYNLEPQELCYSSSGGLFSAFSQHIIKNNGIVIGASFADDFSLVKHITANNYSDLKRIKCSKYVQSYISDTYLNAKQALENGVTVFFTGTPCQIAGLYAFLSKDYANLYTQDVICHGVPSPMLWKRYKEHLEKKHNSKIVGFSFRDKSSGWKNYSIRAVFENEFEYLQHHDKNSFMNIFLSDISLRPSCYSCCFRNMYRESDITLADFWGIENVISEIDNTHGMSLLIINSEKGKELLNSISKQLFLKEVDLSEALKYNPSMTKSPNEPFIRKTFFKEFHKLPTATFLKKYSLLSKIKKICYFAKLTIKNKLNHKG